MAASEMTIEQIKRWLTERGHAQTVRDLVKKRAKKADYVRAANALTKKTPNKKPYNVAQGKPCKAGYRRDGRKCVSCPKPSAPVVPGMDKRWTWGAIAKSGAKAAAGLAAILAFALLAFYYGLVSESAVEQVLGDSRYAASLKAALPALKKLLGLPSTPESVPPPVAKPCGRRTGITCERRVPPTAVEAASQACTAAAKFGKLVSTYVVTFYGYIQRPATKTLVAQILKTGKAAAAAGAHGTVRVLIWILQSRAAEVTRAKTMETLTFAVGILQNLLSVYPMNLGKPTPRVPKLALAGPTEP